MTPLQALDTNEIKVAHPQPWSAQTLTSIDGVNLRYRVMRDTVASVSYTHLDVYKRQTHADAFVASRLGADCSMGVIGASPLAKAQIAAILGASLHLQE